MNILDQIRLILEDDLIKFPTLCNCENQYKCKRHKLIEKLIHNEIICKECK